LLHGWPESADCWRFVIPQLAERFTVIAPDLPGCGDSDTPPDGNHKSAVVRRLSRFVESLGVKRLLVAGHDRGARIAHRFALDRPDIVTRLAVLDVIPMPAVLDSLDALTLPRYWHWFFHNMPDLPEA